MTGSRISGKNSITGAEADVNTIPGSHPNHILKTSINKVAETNSGIVIAKIAKVEPTKSGKRSRQSPVMMPRKIAMARPPLEQKKREE